MEFLEKYLDIEKVRFGDRLHLCVEVPRELYAAQVPSLILQPIVENAVKHGISQRVQAGTIRVSASRLDGMLILSVYNDGPNAPADCDKSASGIGISNMRSRLQGLYGDAFRLNIRNQQPAGVEVSISIPFTEGHRVHRTSL